MQQRSIAIEFPAAPQFLPVLSWIHAQWQTQALARPMVIGLSGPQGSGKTTLVRHLLPVLSGLGLKAVSVSIDDFYLTHADQRALARRFVGNPYLEYRGNAGTHDLALGQSTLAQLRALRAGASMRLPVYDKSLNRGRGDRTAESEWPVVTGPIDLVILDGWMLGLRPVPDAALADPDLIPVNHFLTGYQTWLDSLDAMVVLKIADPQWVFAWRAQQEATLRTSGKPGMSDTEVQDYVRRFIPVYERYLPGLYASDLFLGRQLNVGIGRARGVL